MAFLHWLLVILIDLKIWLITFSACQGLAPSYVLDLLTIYEPLFSRRAPGSIDAGFVTPSQTVLSFKSPVKTQFCSFFPPWYTAFSWSHILLTSHLRSAYNTIRIKENTPHNVHHIFRTHWPIMKYVITMYKH